MLCSKITNTALKIGLFLLNVISDKHPCSAPLYIRL
nr:MAG TPA: hypothetical protein [Caudoviricetes sp.]